MSDRVGVGTTPVGRRFMVVWVGQTLSAIGSMLSGVGIGVWVFLETGSAAWLGVLIAVAGLPTVVLMPVMRLVDRVPRRTMMIGGDLVAAVAALIVLALSITDRLEVWQLAIAGFIGGAGNAFQMPAFQAAIPALVPDAALARANGLTQFGPAVGITIGPLLAAPVVGWWGLRGIVVIDLVTFAIAVGTTLAVRFDDVAARPPADDGSLRSALSWLRSTGRALLVLMLIMSAVNFALSGFNVAVFALAVELGGTELAGVPLAAGGAAMIVGSVWIGARGLPRRRIRAFATALAVFAAGAWLSALRPDLWLLVLGLVIALFAVPVVNAAVTTIFHEHVPAGMQGRVFAARGAIGQALGPAGSLATGGLIAGFAAPAMADDAWAGRTIGRVIGTGDERGPALVLVAVGLGLLVTATWLAVSWINDELDVRAADEESVADVRTDERSAPVMI